MATVRITDTSEDSSMPLDEGRNITGGQSFDEFSETLPEDASLGFATMQPSPSPDGSEPGEGFGIISGDSEPTPGVKKLKMSRKMKAAMNKIRSKVATYPILWFKTKALQNPEWALDEEEEAIIKDSLEFVFEILNIEFQIETLDIKLTSIYWIIAYPIAAIGMIFMIHSGNAKAAHPEEIETK